MQEPDDDLAPAKGCLVALLFVMVFYPLIFWWLWP